MNNTLLNESPEQRKLRNDAILDAQLAADRILKKPRTSKEDRMRVNVLLERISSLKAGYGVDEVLLEEANESERRNGLNVTERLHNDALTYEQRAVARQFQRFLREAPEHRDTKEGVPIVPSSLTGNLGAFVPMAFYNDVRSAMKFYDPVFNEEDVSYLNTSNGLPVQFPIYGDIENVASIVGENSDQSANETDIHSPGAVIVGAYSFRSPLYRVSQESYQDLDASFGLMNLFKRFGADRIARGAGRKLMVGSGVGEPLGLITSLVAAGVTPVVAAGSAGNTGGSETGSTSIGTADLAKLFFSVDAAYRSQPKCAWAMTDATLQAITQLVDKMGNPVVKTFFDGPSLKTYILGKPVKISPSMDNMSSGSHPVLFGDLSYWVTRCARDASYLGVFREAQGLVERGEIGLRLFVRYDGALLYSDTGSPAPMNLIQMHS